MPQYWSRIHRWTESYQIFWLSELRDAFFLRSDKKYDVIFVDWQRSAKLKYHQSAEKVKGDPTRSIFGQIYGLRSWKNMGAIYSYFFGGTPGRTDDPDPVTGLTSRDKYLIQSSWVPVRKDLVKNGVTLLVMFFEKYPADQNFFPFRDIPVKELSTNKKFHAHCSSVMYAVSSIVDSLDDSELLVNILAKTAESHKRRKIPVKSFWNLKGVMIELFAMVMTKDAVQAWDKALDVSFKVMEKQLV